MDDGNAKGFMLLPPFFFCVFLLTVGSDEDDGKRGRVLEEEEDLRTSKGGYRNFCRWWCGEKTRGMLHLFTPLREKTEKTWGRSFALQLLSLVLTCESYALTLPEARICMHTSISHLFLESSHILLLLLLNIQKRFLFGWVRDREINTQEKGRKRGKVLTVFQLVEKKR